MNNSLPMQYYGRGAGKILMPRAILRENRNEWFVKPSFIILIIAISFIIFLKITVINNKKLFKDTKTIIILPETPPIPEPTVKKTIPLIKVLKTAVKKTIEPNKKELTKIIATKPKPLLIKPKKLIPKKLIPKKLKFLDIKKIQVLEMKKIKPLEIKKHSLIPQKIKFTKLNTKKTAHLNKIIAVKKNVPKTAALKATSAPVNKFNIMPGIKRQKFKIKSLNFNPSPVLASGPEKTRPLPKLEQIVASRPQLKKGSPGFAPPKTSIKPSISLPLSQIPLKIAEGTIAYEEMVIIKSTAIGSSGRVKNLKRAILKKAANMNAAKSPYQYNVKGYKCIVIIKANKQVIIEFSPADASFEVVSALERILPR